MYRVVCAVLLVGILGLPVAFVAGQDSSVVARADMTIHVVQRGENLFRIALGYGMTTEELAQLNGIVDPSNIQVGQRLLVPVAGTITIAPQTHTVQPGETLQSIAALYGLTVEDLAAYSNLVDVNTIFVGQILTITPPTETVPVTPEVVAETTAPANVIHVVQPGETLFRIATSYGLTVNEVAAVNGITDPTLIDVGQQLVIPGLEPPQLALDLPYPVTALSVQPLLLVEGQTGRFRLTTAVSSSVSGTFLDRTLNVASEQNNTVHTILVGVPVFTQAGIYPLALTVTGDSGQSVSFSVNIEIVPGLYGSEEINLLSDRSDLLDPVVENAEMELLQRVMGGFTPTHYFSGAMGLPAAAPVVSVFGTRRAYNGGNYDRFHSGTDFAGAPGTPILAAASGYVVMADSLNVRGNATIIDHGWGVYTGYWHQTEQYVHVGDFVTAGQVIGTIGATGRVTGAHLHWEMWVNGVAVDPMQWVIQDFLN
ncbi:MAG: LysM peptidoglycan-binding domain-containing protein [Anaerolineaceae bacterium]|nr:LysM peptidoglycan-binding domain-containing protein [Anaerolineaceae bacterium]